MPRILILLLFVSLQITDLQAQNRIVKFEDIKVLQQNAPKPMVVLIMTSWCKYCHAMKNTLTRYKSVLALLDEKFYTVFLNAEDKSDIFFAGRNFINKGGIHELASELGTIKGQLSYPTLTVLNTRNEIIFQHEGFLSPRAILYTLKKIAEN